MSLFYSGRHRAVRPSTTHRKTGLGVAAVAAAGIATPLMVGTGSASAAPATVDVTTARTTFTGTVSYGSRGSVVKQVQRKVGVSADGIFGPATRSAVQRWQRSHGLTADGVVGPATGSRMGLTGSSSGSSGGGSSSGGSSSGNTSSSSVLGTAARYVGHSYRYGGTTPSGFDCSGFTSYVFGQHGKSLPRTAEAQRQAATRVSSPRPGDLVFFGAPAWHVGIYAGNGQMYDAGNSRTNVSKRAIWTSAVTYGRA